MKKYFGHIIFFTVASIIAVSAGILAFNGMSEKFDQNAYAVAEKFCFEENTYQMVLDSSKYCNDPCYQFKQIETRIEGEKEIDILSKTVVRVENNDGDFEDIDKVSIKNIPANKSLNLMIEKYTLKREVFNKNATFFVTMESFNTTIQPNGLPGINIEFNPDFETSLSPEQIKKIKDIYAQDKSFRFNRPL